MMGGEALLVVTLAVRLLLSYVSVTLICLLERSKLCRVRLFDVLPRGEAALVW
jgi:hypothetical protein